MVGASGQAESVELWQVGDLELDLLDVALWGERVPLAAPLPVAGPGAYLHFFAPRRRIARLHPLAMLADGSWPIYAGQASCLAERAGRYRNALRDVADLRTEDIEVLPLPTGALAAARASEVMLIDMLRPVLNQPFVAGYGSKRPGAKRSGQRPSPFDRLFSGRSWATVGSKADRRELSRQVRGHLAGPGRPVTAWQPPARQRLAA